MASLAPPPLNNQLSCSSEVSTASAYSTPEYEESDPAQDPEQPESPTKIQYCVQRRQTLFVESTLPPEIWDDEMRRKIERQLSSAPDEFSTLIHPTASSRRTYSWNEQAEIAKDDQPKESLSPSTTSRSLSSSPMSISSHRLSSKPLVCMPGLINRDLPTTSSASSPINRFLKTPSPSRPPIRRRIYFYNREDPYYGFTNFSPHEVKYKGKVYPTSEHLFQSFKFQEHRPMLAEHIRLFSDRPSVALSEARRFHPEVRPDWKAINVKMMDETLWHKFHQHEDLKKDLLGTGDAELIEDSDKDSFWGVGADRRGRNELGKALERLRDKLRAEMT